MKLRLLSLFLCLWFSSKLMAQDPADMQMLEPYHIEYLSKDYANLDGCYTQIIEGSDGQLWMNPCHNTSTLLAVHFVQFDGYKFRTINVKEKSQLASLSLIYSGFDASGNLVGYTRIKAGNLVVFFDAHKQQVDIYDLDLLGVEGLEIRNAIISDKGTVYILATSPGKLHINEIERGEVREIITVDQGRESNPQPLFRLSGLPLIQKASRIWFMDEEFPLYSYDLQTGNLQTYDFELGEVSKIKRRTFAQRDDSQLLDVNGQFLLFLPSYRPALFSLSHKEPVIRKYEAVFPADWTLRMVRKDEKDQLLFLFRKTGSKNEAILKSVGDEWLNYSKFVQTPTNRILDIFSHNFLEHVFVAGIDNLKSYGVRQLKNIKQIPIRRSRGVVGMFPNDHFLVYSTAPNNKPILINETGDMNQLTNEEICRDPNFLEALYARPLNRRIIQDEENTYWIHSGSNLVSFDSHSLTSHKYELGLKPIRKDAINNETIALIGENGEVGLFDKKGKEVILLNSGEDRPGYIREFIATSDSVLWIATSGGLWRIDGITRESEVWGTEKGFEDFRFQTILEDNRNNLWLGTAVGGMQRFNRKTGEIEIIDQNQGLISNTVICAVEDDEGYIWVGTNNGLSILTPEGEVLINLTKEDGLPSNQFRYNGAGKLKNGDLVFGLNAGIVLMNPARIKNGLSKKNSGKIFISSLVYFDKKQEKEIIENGLIDINKTVQIPAAHRYLRVGVGLSSYTDAKRNTFAYMLEGLDEDWTYIGNQHEINFSHLPAGEYRLLIKAADFRTNWVEEPIAISILAEEFFYKTTWFYILIFCLLAAITFIWFHRLNTENIRLEKEVSQRTAQIRQDKILIEQQAEELFELDKMKSRFFANISHELRTPLTLILGPIQSLLELESISQKGKIYGQLIQKNAQKLLKRTNEILDLTKLDAKKLQVHKTPNDLYKFLKVFLRSYDATAERRKISLKLEYQLDEGANFFLDWEKFEDILSNYMSNALKYTEEGGTIILSVLEEEGYLTARLSDTGPGIDDKELPHVFTRFYQASNAQDKGGTGIGLAFCRELAELMGGSVWAESSMGEGSSFYIKLPYKTREREGIAEEGEPEIVLGIVQEEGEDVKSRTFQYPVRLPQQTASKTKPTILLVEDNPDLRSYISELVNEYHILQAEDGVEALEILQASSSNGEMVLPNNPEFVSQPSLIISDIMMPKMNGYELLERLKAHPQWQKIPIVMLTALSSEDSKLKALRIGVDDYLTKPFSPEELKVRVKNLLKHYQQRGLIKQKLGNKVVDNPQDIQFEEVAAVDQVWLTELEVKVKEALEQNLEISAVELAEEMALSRRQLLRRLKALTGLSIKKYMLEIKLQKARHLLESKSHHTIAEVAYTCGFNTPKYFSKVFNERFGKKPSKYIEG